VRLTIGPPRTYAQVARSKQSAQTIADDLRRAVIGLGAPAGPIQAAPDAVPDAAPDADLIFLRTLDQGNPFALARGEGVRAR
jgi:hypothetical protein